MSDALSVEELERGLRGLAANGSAELADARVVRRRRNWYTSSFESELVDVVGRAGERKLFCKHGDDAVAVSAGLRRGPGYEAEVYALAGDVLEPLAPRTYGSFHGPHGVTLVLEYVRSTSRLDESNDRDGVVEAARCLGALHRRGAGRAGEWAPLLNRYDRDHYRRRLERPAASTLPHRARVPELLARAEPTIVHGELFAANVLVGTAPVFVDWETAGTGAGELDLAALTIGAWPESVRRSCEEAYVDARWDGEEPAALAATLAAARLYVCAVLASYWARRDIPPQPWLGAQISSNGRALESAA